MIDLDEIKSRINPAYQNTKGTESHERKTLCDEIESLRQQLSEKDSEIERLKKQSARRLIGACSRGEANDELRLQLAAIHDELAKGAEPAAHLSEIWDGMIERRRPSSSVENRIADLSARLDITTHERNNLVETCAKQDARIAELVKELADLQFDHKAAWATADRHMADLADQATQTADATALEAMIAKAGEVMRERCAVEIAETADMVGIIGHSDRECLQVAIRALPGVTLEDLK